VTVTVGIVGGAPISVKQRLVFVGREEGKLVRPCSQTVLFNKRLMATLQVALRQLVHEGIKPPTLIFVQSKERAADLCKMLLLEVRRSKSQKKKK
jgi:ATP-dependent RNA helicase DDX52/ROK1